MNTAWRVMRRDRPQMLSCMNLRITIRGQAQRAGVDGTHRHTGRQHANRDHETPVCEAEGCFNSGLVPSAGLGATFKRESEAGA